MLTTELSRNLAKHILEPEMDFHLEQEPELAERNERKGDIIVRQSARIQEYLAFTGQLSYDTKISTI